MLRKLFDRLRGRTPAEQTVLLGGAAVAGTAAAQDESDRGSGDASASSYDSGAGHDSGAGGFDSGGGGFDAGGGSSF